MTVENHIYDKKFFQNTIKLETESTTQFVNIILEYYMPTNIVDIGCGAGLYLKEFQRRGIRDILGIDGSPAAAAEFLLEKDKLIIFDLAKKYKFKKKYDLSLCLEVAEHLPESDADTLVETIINASDNIIFTAAVLGQGPRSIGHINEQPHSYWIKKFQQRNFHYLESRTKEMKKKMGAQGVVWWLVNNLMIFERA
ncbi:MAG TPA: class I SAM-dependent methyltransferase [Patescibacteria group bacterium]|nr:class I SAM-dependent methyltransferase [Patescibacteria group bacterium]